LRSRCKASFLHALQSLRRFGFNVSTVQPFSAYGLRRSLPFFLLLSQLLGFDSGNAFRPGNGFGWRIVVAMKLK
jgi:hypothetical protein